jgi:hypothetical protein
MNEIITQYCKQYPVMLYEQESLCHSATGLVITYLLRGNPSNQMKKLDNPK